MTDQTNPSIIVGNTESAVAAGTRLRQEAKERWKAWAPYVFGPTFAALLVYLANAFEWNFFWLLIAGVLAYISAHCLSKVVGGTFGELVKPWLTCVKVVSVVAVVATIVDSSFTKYIGAHINEAEETLEMRSELNDQLQRAELAAMVGAAEAELRRTPRFCGGVRCFRDGDVMVDFAERPVANEGVRAVFAARAEILVPMPYGGYCLGTPKGVLEQETLPGGTETRVWNPHAEEVTATVYLRNSGCGPTPPVSSSS